MNAENACCSEMRTLLYDNVQSSTDGIEWGGSSWNLNGCCGGGCYVLKDIKFCPFCGKQTTPPE